MDIQRLRNLTTGRLHTKMEHIYADIEHLTGAEGVMTHQLPNACRALEPYLREKVQTNGCGATNTTRRTPAKSMCLRWTRASAKRSGSGTRRCRHCWPR